MPGRRKPERKKRRIGRQLVKFEYRKLADLIELQAPPEAFAHLEIVIREFNRASLEWEDKDVWIAPSFQEDYWVEWERAALTEEDSYAHFAREVEQALRHTEG